MVTKLRSFTLSDESFSKLKEIAEQLENEFNLKVSLSAAVGHLISIYEIKNDPTKND